MVFLFICVLAVTQWPDSHPGIDDVQSPSLLLLISTTLSLLTRLRSTLRHPQYVWPLPMIIFLRCFVFILFPILIHSLHLLLLLLLLATDSSEFAKYANCTRLGYGQKDNLSFSSYAMVKSVTHFLGYIYIGLQTTSLNFCGCRYTHVISNSLFTLNS